ncbi:MAG: hypothetical protein EBS97_06700, partial [Verrucomicrobia bacterium]|nr:hypothetical protein [Verrucomicrobiota bacterium]
MTSANQTITFTSIPVKYLDEGSFTLNGTASSGLAVSYTSSNTNVATVSGNTVTLRSAGITTITASQAGNSNWNVAANVPQTLNVQARDTDGDGVTDVMELADGTLINDATSFNPLSKGLIAFYPFNGNANDFSGNGYHGTVYGATQVQGIGAQQDSSYRFVNASDWIKSPVGASRFTSDYTLSIWSKIDDFNAGTGGQMHLLSGNLGMLNLTICGFPNDGTDKAKRVSFYMFRDNPWTQVPPGNLWSAQQLESGPWYHLVVRRMGSTYSIFIDGVLSVALTDDRTFAMEDSFIEIGNAFRTPPITSYYHGSLDNLRMYDRALSLAEISQVYVAESGNLDTDGDGLTDAWERGYGRYQIIPGNFTWEQAKADAEARGGHLATITSEAEWNFVRTVLSDDFSAAYESGADIWLGGSDLKVEGQWEWVTSEIWGFHDWRTGQPNNISDSGDADFLELETHANILDWGNEGRHENLDPLWGNYYVLEFGYPTDPTKADTDGDGFNDSIESHYASDPNNPAVTPNTIRPAGRVVAWGKNSESQCVVPSGMTNVIQVSGGFYHSLALKNDGSVVAWGSSGYAQARVPPGLSNVVSVNAGWYNSLALLGTGEVVEWDSIYEQGDIPKPSNLRGVVAIDAGEFHSLALKADGEVVGWGRNLSGESVAPTSLAALKKITAGGWSSGGIGADNNFTIWGAGQLEGGTTILSSVRQASIGGEHVLFLRDNGAVNGYGQNSSGQASPPAGLTNIVAVEAGGYHSLALSSNGTVFAWGANGSGQTLVPARLRDVVSIGAGRDHSLAITTAPAEEPPTIGLTPNPISFLEGASGRTVGTITLADPDGNAADLIVTLGGVDASSFSVTGTGATRNLVVALPTDFESGKTSFTLTLTVTDVQGLTASVNASAALTDDRNEDADGDGLTERQEEDIYGTSDLLSDTDGDGASDPLEISLGTDPKAATFSIDGLTNGTFEEGPTLPPNNPPVNSFSFIPEGQVRGWKTTASDHIIELWYSGHEGVPSYQGPIFAELDANMRGTLYQDVIMTRSGYVDYSFLHRARNTADSMQFKIEELVGGPGSAVAAVRYSRDFTTGQTWTRYEGGQVTTVAAGKVYRFSYVSLSPGSSSVGNFLDDAKFGIGVVQGIPPAILSTNPILGTVGEPLNYALEATGTSHLIFSASGLPTNTAMGSSSGVISGIPQATGSGTAQIVVTNSYGAATNTLAWNIAPASGSITFTNLLHTYDRTGKAATAVVNPTNATYIVTYNGSTNLPVAAGSYEVVGTLTGNFTGSVTNTLVIGAREVGITGLSVLSRVYDGSTTATIRGTPVLGNVVAGDSVGVAGTAQGSFADQSAGAGKIVPVTGLSLTGSLAGNYTIGPIIVSGEITKRPVQVVAGAGTKVYGQIDPTLTYSPSSSLLAGDSFSGSLVREAGESAGEYNILQGTLSAGGNYQINFMGAKFTIVPAAASISLTNLVHTYDGTGKTPLALVSPADATYTLTYNGSTNLPVQAGSYAVVGTLTGNYFGSTRDTLTIQPKGLGVNGLVVKKRGYEGDNQVRAPLDWSG